MDILLSLLDVKALPACCVPFYNSSIDKVQMIEILTWQEQEVTQQYIL